MNKNKILTVTTTIAVVISSIQAVPVFAANFSDINDVPWEGAKTYINAVADAGLMVGDYDDAGKSVFRSRDGVTYCETMQLAYTLMKAYTGTKVADSVVSKYTSVMNGYQIPTWAQEAVAYGLENKIVTISEVPGFVNSKGVSVNATRQDVAIMFGRTLEQIESVNSSPTLKFGDAASITSTAVPYVDLLNRLGIITGDTDGNFTPKTSINRAEMSVVVSKTHDFLNNKKSGNTTTTPTTPTTSGSISGTVTGVSVSGNNITISVSSGGTTTQFTGTTSTSVLDTNSSKTTMDKIVTGDSVLVSYTGATVNSIMITASATNTSATTGTTAKGTLVSFGTRTIKLKVSGSEKSYEMDDVDEIYFKYDGTIKKYSSFKDLIKEGDSVTVTLDGNGYVTYVVAESSSSSYDVEGYYSSISSKAIMIKSTKSGSEKTYYFEDKDSDNVEFYKSKSGSSVSYTSFKNYVEENDRIGLVYNKDDDVVEVYIISGSSSSSDSKKGQLYSLSSSKLRLKNDSTSYVIDDGDDIDIDVDDGDNNIDDFDDLKEAFNDDEKVFYLTIEYDDDYIVTSIEGYIYSISNAKIYSVDTGSDTITFKLSSGKYTYDVDTDGDFDCDDYTDSLSGVKKAVNAESEVYADVEFDSKGNITSVTLDY